MSAGHPEPEPEPLVPQDKVLCLGRFRRKVVACMDHCPFFDNYCTPFWDFFRHRGVTPAEYYNAGGIGEKVMRRIVYDCDRCGRRAVQPVYALDITGDEGTGPLGEEARRDAVLSRGYSAAAVTEAAYLILGIVQREKGWEHFCGVCFRHVCDGVAKALGERRPKKAKPQVAPEPVIEAEPVVVAAPAPTNGKSKPAANATAKATAKAKAKAKAKLRPKAKAKGKAKPRARA